MSVLDHASFSLFCRGFFPHVRFDDDVDWTDVMLVDPGTPRSRRTIYDLGDDHFVEAGTQDELPKVDFPTETSSLAVGSLHRTALRLAPELSARTCPTWYDAFTLSALRRSEVAFGDVFRWKAAHSLV
ncbi:hypothetical protein FOZ61_001649, partial [Perkinsus olseni]